MDTLDTEGFIDPRTAERVGNALEKSDLFVNTLGKLEQKVPHLQQDVATDAKLFSESLHAPGAAIEKIEQKLGKSAPRPEIKRTRSGARNIEIEAEIPGETAPAVEASTGIIASSTLTPRDRTIKRLDRGGRWGGNLIFGEMIGNFVLGGIGGLFIRMKMHRTGAALQVLGQGVFTTLQQADSIFKVPRLFWENVHIISKNSGGETGVGKAAKNWAPAAEKRAERAAIREARRIEKMQKRMAPIVEALDKHTTSVLDKVSRTGIGGWLEKLFQRVGGSRAVSISRRLNKRHLKADAAFNHEKRNYFQQALDWVTNKKPREIGMPDELGSASSMWKDAQGLTGAERTAQIELVKEELKSVAESSSEHAGHAARVLRHVEKSHALSTAAESMSAMETHGLADMFKSVVKSASHMSVLGKAATLFAVAGSGGVILAHRQHQKQMKHALNELSTLLEDPDSEIMKNAQASFHSQRRSHRFGTVMGIGDQASNVFFAAVDPARLGFGVMVAAGATGMGSSFVKNSAELNALINLLKNERHEIKLSGEQKLKYTAQLLMLTDGIKKHGMEGNDALVPFAELVQDMSIKDIVNLPSHPEKFTPLIEKATAEAHTRRAPAKDHMRPAISGKEAKKPEMTPEKPSAAVAPETTAETPQAVSDKTAAYLAAPKPPTSVAAGGAITLNGKIEMPAQKEKPTAEKPTTATGKILAERAEAPHQQEAIL